MPSVFESIINDRLSQLLKKEFDIDSRAERTHRKRPDITCYHNGLLIGIELSYGKSYAENDAQKRLEEPSPPDLVIAVWIKDLYKDVPEDKLDNIIKESKFDIKIITEMQESLLPFLGRRERYKGRHQGKTPSQVILNVFQPCLN